MKRMNQTVMAAAVMTVAFAGVAQAGRSSDEPVAVHKVTTAEQAADAAVAYTGRPNESVAVAPIRSEGSAEFAVMDVRGGAAGGVGAYHGRPMDNPVR